MNKKLLKVELHVHTHFSYDTRNYFHKIITKAVSERIDAIAVCDHNQIEGALKLSRIAPFKVIVGEEIMTTEGEIIGLFLHDFIKPGLTPRKTIDEIKKQGGLVYIPHPFDATTRSTSLNKRFLENLIEKVDILETHNGRTVKEADNVKAAKFAYKTKKTPATGSDAHTASEIGRNYMIMQDFDNANSFLRSLKTALHKTSRPDYYAFLATKIDRNYKKILTADNKKSEKFTCDICRSSEYRILYKAKGKPRSVYLVTDDSYGTHGQIVQCKACLLKQVYPKETEEKIEKRYKEFSDQAYQEEITHRAQNQKKMLKKINKLIPNKGKMLEVGCATGAFLNIARKKGWKVYGVEPSRWARDIAKREYGLDKIKSSLKSRELKSNYFDVVVMVDVIEHLYSPDKKLRSVARLLKKGGLLVIITPDSGAIIPKILQDKWWHIRPDHIFYFSGFTLSNLLIKNNFQIVKTGHYGWKFSLDYWFSRVFVYLPFLKAPYYFINRMSGGNLGKIPLSLNLLDSMQVYAVKR